MVFVMVTTSIGQCGIIMFRCLPPDYLPMNVPNWHRMSPARALPNSDAAHPLIALHR